MDKKFLITGTVFGLLAVIIGAFGAHGLKPLLDEAARNSFETGVKYQMYHALLFLLIGSLNRKQFNFQKKVFFLLLFGVICFSGSIYLLATNNLTPIDFKGIALVTPLGGTLLIAGWIFLLIEFVKIKHK
ncbi:Uncharacterized membrane protein YgdD, TMEM256/DUF423 family [Salegentibacter holothuriorum]|uniref:Uncharacterized membrane protein YgdD, TMEM256/DUF423 family n=1 Tax=Salegentibacter holothuriorum TaxID=241145 RepID=A0A1T5C4W1_9FLAO|nr:DUF423 domain-containing protein [Salegentibacter holothuriorum]SKB54457.1 Uncharacterized membrane protein YgdD, TMEM256/DUF423 family [Salegentibacter holothuriorum]